ncbi:MAG: c-type cytochrome [Thermoanaerobaculia bacterium]
MKCIATIGSVLLLSACAVRPLGLMATVSQPLLVARAGAVVDVSNGDAAEGRALFTKLNCDSCHSLSGRPAGSPHPLPDLTEQPPDAVAAMITEGSAPAPEVLFEQVVMSTVVSQVTPQEVAHLVAYLRSHSDGR